MKCLTLCIVLCAGAVVHFGHAETIDDNEEQRIINGVPAGSGQFPWMVGIQPQNSNGNWAKWHCGGALIARNLVLTATHCFDAATPKAYRVTLGSTLPGDLQDGDGKTIRYVDLLITHGEAMIFRLSQSVQFTNKIKPVSLPSSNQDYLGPNVPVTVSGWGGIGENNSGSQSDKLLYTTLISMTNAKCKEYFSIRDDTLCYMNQQSTTCGGDSGSPVVAYINNVAVHVGIHDAGVCKLGWPSVATRTSDHVDWIKSEIRRHAP